MNVLFICTFNQLRSATAEQIFKKEPGLSVRSAGTSQTAIHRINSSDLNWAWLIFVMEKKHQEYLQENFSNEMQKKKVINLNIPDEFSYMDPDLVEVLKTEVGQYL